MPAFGALALTLDHAASFAHLICHKHDLRSAGTRTAPKRAKSWKRDTYDAYCWPETFAVHAFTKKLTGADEPVGKKDDPDDK